MSKLTKLIGRLRIEGEKGQGSRPIACTKFTVAGSLEIGPL